MRERGGADYRNARITASKGRVSALASAQARQPAVTARCSGIAGIGVIIGIGTARDERRDLGVPHGPVYPRAGGAPAPTAATPSAARRSPGPDARLGHEHAPRDIALEPVDPAAVKRHHLDRDLEEAVGRLDHVAGSQTAAMPSSRRRRRTGSPPRGGHARCSSRRPDAVLADRAPARGGPGVWLARGAG
jgi:hypothetical protein